MCGSVFIGKTCQQIHVLVICYKTLQRGFPLRAPPSFHSAARDTQSFKSEEKSFTNGGNYYPGCLNFVWHKNRGQLSEDSRRTFLLLLRKNILKYLQTFYGKTSWKVPRSMACIFGRRVRVRSQLYRSRFLPAKPAFLVCDGSTTTTDNNRLALRMLLFKNILTKSFRKFQKMHLF